MTDKHLSGRPTKYTPELLEQARNYLETYEEEGDVIPSIAGLAIVLRVSRSTVHEWKKEEGKEAFSDILEELLSKQEKVLMNRGLIGEFNSNIVKLALGKHGYSDKHEQEIKAKVETNDTTALEAIRIAIESKSSTD